MPFIKNMWYVASWDHELNRDKPIGRTILSEPIALYRRSDGGAVAVEDRCSHRHAPLSVGRVEGDNLRCMYHGMLYGPDGVCKAIPGTTVMPPNTTLRTFPVVERSSWIWVWMGDPAKADPGRVPYAVGLEDPEWVMRASALDYEADYQLINDNLCDLSHLDFVHETTLGYASGSKWSSEQPKITSLDNGLLIERWFVDRVVRPGGELVDAWSSYQYLLPGIFLMNTWLYKTGSARANQFATPSSPALFKRCDQQAVTPIADNRSRYLFATGTDRASSTSETLERMFAVVNAAFAEDRAMIEAQQRIWNVTPQEKQKAFIPQDKAPSMMRRKISNLLAEEQKQTETA
jgi:phenylpropionate dioxygenase-like ring-hydroxylating dioxygenase large terminal subunit